MISSSESNKLLKSKSKSKSKSKNSISKKQISKYIQIDPGSPLTKCALLECNNKAQHMCVECFSVLYCCEEHAKKDLIHQKQCNILEQINFLCKYPNTGELRIKSRVHELNENYTNFLKSTCITSIKEDKEVLKCILNNKSFPHDMSNSNNMNFDRGFIKPSIVYMQAIESESHVHSPFNLEEIDNIRGDNNDNMDINNNGNQATNARDISTNKLVAPRYLKIFSKFARTEYLSDCIERYCIRVKYIGIICKEKFKNPGYGFSFAKDLLLKKILNAFFKRNELDEKEIFDSNGSLYYNVFFHGKLLNNSLHKSADELGFLTIDDQNSNSNFLFIAHRDDKDLIFCKETELNKVVHRVKGFQERIDKQKETVDAQKKNKLILQRVRDNLQKKYAKLLKEKTKLKNKLKFK